MKMIDKNKLKNILKIFDKITQEPVTFLRPQPDKYSEICELLEQIYDVAVQSDLSNVRSPDILTKLVFEDMDEEQIWQQLQLRNRVVIPQLVESTAQILAINEDELAIELNEEDQDEDEQSNEDQDDYKNYDSENEKLNEKHVINDDANGDDDDDDDDDDDEAELLGLKVKPSKQNVRTSIVDDKFFKLHEMEAFLDQEDAKEMQKQKGKLIADEDGIDYFADDLGNDDDSNTSINYNPKYSDFFDIDEDLEVTGNIAKKKQIDYFVDSEQEEEKVENNENQANDDSANEESEQEVDAKNTFSKTAGADWQPVSDSNDSDVNDDSDGDGMDDNKDNELPDDKPKSSFEMREERLKQRIRDYESEVLGQKPWQLRGEIRATNRPQNSLLEEILEFESTTRPVPIITEATTRCLEDIIKQRIKDKAWDDVEFKVRPVQTPQDYRKQLVLDQEKSKQSLAQIYEKEYQQELDKFNPNRTYDEQTKEPKEHEDIRRMMRTLFVKLDALTNFHFIPKPVAPEPKIITNTPAINMEEVAPVAVSDAKLLAPEEVYRGPKYDVLGKTERTRTDKNRERRKKKQKQRAINKAIEARNTERLKQGKPLSKNTEDVKLLKSITKHRNVKMITSNNDQGALKSSKAFFSKLQDTTKNVTTKRAAKIQTDTTKITAKRLKL